MAITLGKTNATDPIGQRDAIHVPVILVKATGKLKPGDRVRFLDITFTTVERAKSTETYHAVVDPFLDNTNSGDHFAVILAPGMTRDLTHHYRVELPDAHVLEDVSVEFEEEEDDGCRGCN